MINNDEDIEEEEQQKSDRKRKKLKEQFLDEAYKKAELLKKAHLEIKKEQKLIKKPFIKIGIIAVIIAIIGLALINYVPWMYIKYDSDNGTIEEYFSYKDFNNNDIEIDNITSLFESTCNNCSNNSKNYIGLTINDFTGSQRTIFNSLIVLALLGLIFTGFIIIDRFKNFSEETVNFIHSFFIGSTIFIDLIIFLSTIKFLGAHILMQLNRSFIEVLGLNNINLFFFAPYIFFISSLFLVIMGLMLIKANFNKAIKNLESQKSHSNYPYRSNL